MMLMCIKVGYDYEYDEEEVPVDYVLHFSRLPAKSILAI